MMYLILNKLFSPLSLILVFFLALNLFSSAQGNSIDLTSYSSYCGSSDIQAFDELSGLCFDFDRQRFFAIEDGRKIVELSRNGTVIKSGNLSGSIHDDPEGITYLGNGKFAITDERNRQIDFVTINNSNANLTTSNLGTISTTGDSGQGNNNGFEGIAYDFNNDLLYIGKEGDEDNNSSGVEPRVIVIADPLSKLNDTINSLQDAFVVNFACGSGFDIAGLSMTTTGSLLIVSENCKRVFEVDPTNGQLLSNISVNSDFRQPEGIIVVNESEIAIAGEESNANTGSQFGRYFPHLFGDVNLDNQANLFDAIFITQYEVGIRPVGDCNNLQVGEICIETGDANCNGILNLFDAILINQCSVGLPNLFCP